MALLLVGCDINSNIDPADKELDDEIVGKILETKIKKPAAEIKKKEPVTEEWTQQNIFDSGTVPKEQETEVPEDEIDIDNN